MSKKPETKFKERVLLDLKTIPRIAFFKIQQVSVRGVPDILMCADGHFIAIELKKDAKSAPDELQKYNLRKIADSGGISIVASPENWSDVFSALCSFLSKKKRYDVPRDFAGVYV